MKIRMVPVEQLFRRFPRVVRDVARQSGKEIELTVKGVDTDLDKRILDAIAEPLTHLVRNAIGHGIEPGEERVRAGKRAQGTLRLNAYHQGNQVVIEVSDDGHGIDVQKVRQRAISQGLLTSEDAGRLTESETLDMIFRGRNHRTFRSGRRSRRRAERTRAFERNGSDRNRGRPWNDIPPSLASHAGHYQSAALQR